MEKRNELKNPHIQTLFVVASSFQLCLRKKLFFLVLHGIILPFILFIKVRNAISIQCFTIFMNQWDIDKIVF